MTRALNFDEIKRILPHRYPMLLVDRVVDLDPGVALTAHKAVSGNEPWYRDLTAADYAYPSVLLVESWCQAAGVLASTDPAGLYPVAPDLIGPDPAGTTGPANSGALGDRVMLIGGMAGIRFSGRIFPGDLVEHRVRLVRSVGDTAIFEGESLVDGRTVLEVERVVVALRPAAELAGTAAGEPAAELAGTAASKPAAELAGRAASEPLASPAG